MAWSLSDQEKKMKRPITVLALALLVFGPLACGKDNISINYALLRHKWNIVSITGEAYGYHGQPGDYFDFRADNKLYRHSAGNFDTLAYILVNGGKSLQLYNIQNGQRLGWYILDIDKLSSSACILHKCEGPPFCILDSLSR
jgi:hypothetical protein